MGKHKNTKHVVQSCTQCNLKFVTMIELLKHISIEHVEEEEDLDQSSKIGHHITDTEPINIKAIR